MKKVLIGASVLALAIITISGNAVAVTWNKNPTFDGSPPDYWAREHFKWSTDGSCSGPLDEAWFWWGGYGGAHGANYDTNSNCYGVIRYRQGETPWGGGNPGNLEPLPVYGKQMELPISVKRVDDGDYVWWFNGRTMYAVNLWFTSPELTKPLVMDIIYDVGPWDGWCSFEDDAAYHYQLHVPYNSNCGLASGHYMSKGVWYNFNMDLDWHIQNAFCNLNGYGFDICYALDTAVLKDVEMLLELQEAWGEFEVDNLYVNYW
jgi:hypothetical protein